MKALFISGSSLKTNSSTTISNINYLKGLIDNDIEVTLLMPTAMSFEIDKSINIPSNITIIEFENRSSIRKIMAKTKRDHNSNQVAEKQIKNKNIISIVKNIFLNIIKITIKKYDIIRKKIKIDADSYWIKNASKYRSDINYDLVISNSYPVSSHKTAANLIKRGYIKYRSWIQIWQDPWSKCLYAEKYSRTVQNKMYKEEYNLLKIAEKIVYVSPMTLANQKSFFPKFASKMHCVVLPSSDISNGDIGKGELKIGYFGEYFNYVRNILPLYNVLNEKKIYSYIVGTSNIVLKESDCVRILPRMSYNEVKKIEANMDVLVNISNLSGGQIPGKVYYYAATNKIILFILDGKKEEIITLRDYFGKYNRYIFCDNNEESIRNTLNYIIENIKELRNQKPIASFTPKNIVNDLINVMYYE